MKKYSVLKYETATRYFQQKEIEEKTGYDYRCGNNRSSRIVPDSLCDDGHPLNDCTNDLEINFYSILYDNQLIVICR